MINNIENLLKNAYNFKYLKICKILMSYFKKNLFKKFNFLYF